MFFVARLCAVFFVTSIAHLPAREQIDSSFRPSLAQYTSSSNSSFSYISDKTPLDAIIRDIAAKLGVSFVISPGINGVISGRFSADSAEKLLDILGVTQGFSWVIAENCLILFSSEDTITRIINNPFITVEKARQVLQPLGRFNAFVSLQSQPNQRLKLKGPPALLEIAIDALRRDTHHKTSTTSNATVTTWRKRITEEEFGLFVLKHANVQDRTLMRRKEPLVIPGMGSIVRRLVAANMPDDPGLISIVEDTRLNALIVRGPKSVMPAFQALIDKLDIPVPLIQLEAMIVDIDASKTDQLGIDWSVTAGRNKIEMNMKDIQGTTPALLTFSAAQKFVAKVRALEENQQADIISKPSLLTLSNATALLDLSETFYILNNSERHTETVPVTVGLLLHVTPRVIAANKAEEVSSVMMQIDIEDGKSGRINDAETSKLPLTTKNNTVSTQAIVKDKESLLLAGFQRKEVGTGESHVPILSSIPLLGNLFRYTNSKNIHRKRYFLITPRIIPIDWTEKPSFPLALQPILEE